jgi:ankyrin repeat protein
MPVIANVLIFIQFAAYTASVRTALHKAAFEGQERCVAELLSCKAPMASQDEGGASPLHLAALAGHVPILQILLKSGAKYVQQL